METGKYIKLIGITDIGASEVFHVEIHAAHDHNELYEAMLRLFNKVYKAELGQMVNVAFTCGMPGERAWIWKATSIKGMRERYLHISFSDGRNWT